MKKTLFIVSTVAFIFIMLILTSGCNQQQKSTDKSLEETDKISPDDAADSGSGMTPEQKACINSGGEWKQFPNTCADSCSYKRGQKTSKGIMCGQAITKGCYCGEDKCWNGVECERI